MLVAYLYDEINAEQKIRFEEHLAGCPNCEAELASFGLVRSSITYWKQTDFEGLTPLHIELPAAEKVPALSPGKNSLAAQVRNFIFGLAAGPFNWKTAAAAGLPVLIIAFLALTFLLTSAERVEIAGPEKPRPAKITPEDKQIVSDAETADLADNETDQEIPTSAGNVPDNVKAAEPDVARQNPAPATPKRKSPTRSGRQVAKKKKQSENPPVNQNQKPNDQINAATNSNRSNAGQPFQYDEQEPIKLSDLTGETEEDNDSIRLIDLFDEVGGDDR